MRNPFGSYRILVNYVELSPRFECDGIQVVKRWSSLFPDEEMAAPPQGKAQVGTDCLIGEGTHLSDKCSIKHSVLGQNCTIEDKVRIINCVLMDNVTVKEGYVHRLHAPNHGLTGKTELIFPKSSQKDGEFKIITLTSKRSKNVSKSTLIKEVYQIPVS